MNMLKHYLTSLILLHLNDITSQQTRCTRRYSAGLCVEPVKPVWTFVFQQQDCMQRLGCPPTSRVNRFGSYEVCMRRCKALIDVYTQLLMENELNVTYSRSRPSDLLRRSNIKITADMLKDMLDANNPEEDRAQDTFPSNNFEDESLQHILPVDIDDVTEDHNMLDVFDGDQ
ncbi:uncharacterized protein [Epargyreus clarus]|uniref:uncharacterized protein isoform X2 n=1 Tax=Epargyreus clarus TaxID=520877 RepID=UPI003C2EE74F